MSPGGVADLGPRGMVGRICEVDHLRLLNTKCLNSGPHGFGEEDFLSFSHYKSMRANEPLGVANLVGAWLAGFM